MVFDHLIPQSHRSLQPPPNQLPRLQRTLHRINVVPLELHRDHAGKIRVEDGHGFFLPKRLSLLGIQALFRGLALDRVEALIRSNTGAVLFGSNSLASVI